MNTETPTLPDIMFRRRVDTHKGDYGHALLIAGSYGKGGAAVLAARAALRSGVGLLTVHVPRCLVTIMQTSVPEAMLSTDADEHRFSQLPSHLDRYDAVAVGPGIGTDAVTRKALTALLSAIDCPLVLDADALNIVALDKLQSLLKANTVITPHDGEYRRLYGASDTEQIARQQGIVIVRKGYHSHIYAPNGMCYCNTTGNPGMATAGSGDVLTGIVLAMLTQHLAAVDAARLAVYLHGRAGDIAAETQSQASLIASDIVEGLRQASLPDYKK